jgi:hypothetical protein
VRHTEGDKRGKNAGEMFYGAQWYPSGLLREAAALPEAVHSLPAGLPGWQEFQRRTLDFLDVAHAATALPLKQRRTRRDESSKLAAPDSGRTVPTECDRQLTDTQRDC